MSTFDPLQLTDPSLGWATNSPILYSMLTDQNGPPGYFFNNGVDAFGGFVPFYSQLISHAPANILTPDQQTFINYLLSGTSASALGFSDVHFRDSFSDVANIQFELSSSAVSDIFVSNATLDGALPTDNLQQSNAAGTTVPPVHAALQEMYVYNHVISPSASNSFNLGFDANQVPIEGVFVYDPTTNTTSQYSLGTGPGTYSIAPPDADGHSVLSFGTLPPSGDVVRVAVGVPSGFQGDVFYSNPAFTAPSASIAPGSDLAEVTLHELAHAVGLLHAPTDPSYGPYNTQKYTIMTESGTTTSPDVPTVHATGLQLYDIAALQSLYGRNYSTRSEDGTIYTGGTVSGVIQAFGADKSQPFLYTIWDGGGNHNSINASGYSGDAEIDLRQGHFSSIGSNGAGGTVSFDSGGVDHGNVAIAYHTIIQDAVGTDQGDVLIGNDWGNTLWGGKGNDFIFGDGSLYDGDHGYTTVDPNDPNDPNRLKPASNADNDVLIGGADNDIMMAGNGTNQIVCGGDAITDQSGNITGSTDDGFDTYIIAMGQGDTASALVGKSTNTAVVSDSSGETNTTLYQIDAVYAQHYDPGNNVSLVSSPDLTGPIHYQDMSTDLSLLQAEVADSFAGVNINNCPVQQIQTADKVWVGNTYIAEFINFGNLHGSADGGDEFDLNQVVGGRTLTGGGDGNNPNTISYAGLSNTAGVTIDLDQGFVRLNSSAVSAGPSGPLQDSISNFQNVEGSAYNDTIVGDINGTQSNTFFGSTGNDTYTGGGGVNTLDYSKLSEGIAFSWNNGAMTVEKGTISGSHGDLGTDTLNSIQVVNGSNLDDTFSFSGGFDSTHAMTIDGGLGENTLDYSHMSAPGITGVVVSMYSADIGYVDPLTDNADVGEDSFSNVQNFILTSGDDSFNAYLGGHAVIHTIDGNGGTDQIALGGGVYDPVTHDVFNGGGNYVTTVDSEHFINIDPANIINGCSILVDPATSTYQSSYEIPAYIYNQLQDNATVNITQSTSSNATSGVFSTTANVTLQDGASQTIDGVDGYYHLTTNDNIIDGQPGYMPWIYGTNGNDTVNITTIPESYQYFQGFQSYIGSIATSQITFFAGTGNDTVNVNEGGFQTAVILGYSGGEDTFTFHTSSSIVNYQDTIDLDSSIQLGDVTQTAISVSSGVVTHVQYTITNHGTLDLYDTNGLNGLVLNFATADEQYSGTRGVIQSSGTVFSGTTDPHALVHLTWGDDGYTMSANFAGELDTLGGNDTIHANSLDNATYLGDGDDTYFGGSGNDTIHAGGGTDTIYAGSGNETIYGGSGDDTIYAGAGNDTIHGGTGNNDFVLGSGNTTVYADPAGYNTFEINGTGHVSIVGYDANHDTIQYDDPNITPQQISMSRVGDDLVLSDPVTISGFFDSNTGQNETIDIHFASLGPSSSPASTATYTIDSTGHILSVVINNGSGGGNEAPIAENGSFTMDENGTLTGNVLADNGHGATTDPDGDTVTAMAGTFATANGGTVVIAADGSFTYTPQAEQHGTDSFTYMALDPQDASSTATITVGITPDTPAAKDGSFTLSENNVLTGNVLADNGHGATSDPDGDLVGAQTGVFTTAHGGTVEISGNGDFNYTPAAGFHGTDNFTYTALDAQGESGSATITIAVTPDMPLAENGSFTLAENGTLTGNVLVDNGFGAASDPDNDLAGVTAGTFTTAHGGTVALAANGDFTYTPAVGFFGSDSFAYSLSDQEGETATANINIGVAQGLPVAQNAGFSIAENAAFTGNVLADNGHGAAFDSDGDVLTAQAGTFATANGSVTIAANGDFTYTPNAGFFGADTFNYTALDGFGGAATATMTVNIAQDLPIAEDGSFTMQHDSTLSGNLLADNGFGAASDPDGDLAGAQAASFTTANGGSVIINSDGTFIYTPAAGFTGSDTFNYSVLDSDGASSSATVQVRVTGGEPVVYNETIATPYGQPVTGNVLANNGSGAAFDPDGDPLHLVGTAALTADGFQVQLASNGDFAAAIPAWFVGEDSFSYTVADTDGDTSSAIATLNITAPANAIVGTSGNDNIDDTSNTDHSIFTLQGNDVVQCGGGTDTVYLGPGNDTAYAGTGVDTMIGGGGNDTFYVNSTQDVVIENNQHVADTIISSVSFTLSQNVHDLVFTGTGNLTATCNNQGDTVVTNSGVDTVIGGTGDDTIYVNNSNDVIIEHAGHNSVIASVDFRMAANGIESLTFTGSTSLTGFGNNLDNTMTANNAGDVLKDGNGNDTIMGGLGDDVITAGSGTNLIYGGGGNDLVGGGNGSDTFLFKDSTAFTGVETIKNFSANGGHSDVIDIKDIIDTVNPSGTNLGNFLDLTHTGNIALLAVNPDGSGWINIAKIEHGAGLDLDTMIAQGSLIV